MHFAHAPRVRRAEMDTAHLRMITSKASRAPLFARRTPRTKDLLKLTSPVTLSQFQRRLLARVFVSCTAEALFCLGLFLIVQDCQVALTRST